MKTSDILALDFRKEENKKIVNKCLCKIKPFSKYKNDILVNSVPIEIMEKMVHKICTKYEVYVMDIMPSCVKEEQMYYSCLIKRTDSGEVEHVYAMCIYELFAKICIKLYSDVKNGRLNERW